MKLKDWSDKVGVTYLTAYRWFKAGSLPVHAYQTSSGTIIVEEDPEEVKGTDTETSAAISLLLKKTIEYTVNNSSVEEFAAYILSNFTLKLSAPEQPKYSKNKPKTEEVQNHYKQMLSNMKKEKPAPCMYFPPTEVLENLENDVDTNGLVNSNQGLVKQIHASDEDVLVTVNESSVLKNDSLNVEDLQKAIANYVNAPAATYFTGGITSSPITTGSVITCADLNPQNYTYSTNCASSSLGSFNLLADDSTLINLYNSLQKVDAVQEKPKRGRPKKIGSFKREDS